MSIVVNLFGAPSAGKSTGAAYVFAKLKLLGIDAELSLEFAKEKVWEGDTEILNREGYVFKNQEHRLLRLLNKVDVIVTDAPLLLTLAYRQNKENYSQLDYYINKVFNCYDNLNFLINRVKKYNPNGRLQTELESNKKRNDIIEVLNHYNVNYEECDGCESGYDRIVASVINKIDNK